jgi:hypothetical protein
MRPSGPCRAGACFEDKRKMTALHRLFALLALVGSLIITSAVTTLAAPGNPPGGALSCTLMKKETPMSKIELNASTSLSTPTDMLDATKYAGVNNWKGAEIDRRYLVTFTSASHVDFTEKDGTKTREIALGTDEGRTLVMNKTRNKQAIRAWGPNALTWVGKQAVLFPAQTVYAGEVVASIGFQPITGAKLTAPEALKAIDPPAPPPVAAEYPDEGHMVPEGVVDDDAGITEEIV